ncbi:sigma factor-like helix-turn-helix DNA-binding protein [Streptomyces eurythermus]|uniref:sigma factor-like helix-turn-helix DNA-binding protein n=1 Tax=Streptomyces eurythermus TaxID=42237 RepID=UPI0036FA461F
MPGERQLSVVVLRHWKDFSATETTQALDISPGTVESTLGRALETPRQGLTTARAAAWLAATAGTVTAAGPREDGR